MISNPLYAKLPAALASPWAWFAALAALSFLANDQLRFDSRYTELAAHGFIGAAAVIFARLAARRFSNLALRLTGNPSAFGYANGAVVIGTVFGAILGALVGFQVATLYTREMLSAGANRTAMQERQREWLDEKTKTNLIRPDQPYRLGLPTYQYIGLPSAAAR